MACGIDPIYCKAPQIDLLATTPLMGATANTSLVLASSVLGTDVFAVFTADATNGGFIQKLRFKPGVSASSTTLTVARIFINNGSAPATAANNVFYDDITLPVVTPAINAGSPAYELFFNIALPAGYRILVAFGTATGNGWQCVAFGGKY